MTQLYIHTYIYIYIHTCALWCIPGYNIFLMPEQYSIMEGCPISYWTNLSQSPKIGHLDYFQFSTIINNSATTLPTDKSFRVVLFIALGSIPRVRSLLRRLIVLPNCPPERLYLFMLLPAASKKAHFPTSLLTSGLIKHYILSLFNPGSELFFLLLLSWRQRFLAQGTGNTSLWGRLWVRNCYLSQLQQNHKSFLGLAEDPCLQIPYLW